MKIEGLKLAYFSPTGTTKTIVQAIARVINHSNVEYIDVEKCVVCCACIKGCPEDAKMMKEGKIMDIAQRLQQMCGNRKEPEFYFP